jgi:hypothetical protein
LPKLPQLRLVSRQFYNWHHPTAYSYTLFDQLIIFDQNLGNGTINFRITDHYQLLTEHCFFLSRTT